MTIPNLLTLLRVILIPILIIVFYLPVAWNHFGAAFIFTIAAITDWFDGYLARSLQQTSQLGKFLDPVADKLIVVVVIVLLAESFHTIWFTLPAAVIVGREILVSALREWMAEMGKRASVAVNWMGKVKTTLQMVALVFLLLYKSSMTEMLLWLGYLLFYIAAGLTLWSMLIYIKIAWPEFIRRP